jgi:hypothetical protein
MANSERRMHSSGSLPKPFVFPLSTFPDPSLALVPSNNRKLCKTHTRGVADRDLCQPLDLVHSVKFVQNSDLVAANSVVFLSEMAHTNFRLISSSAAHLI